MHEEQSFLDQLIGDPNDDVTRLVYADWLDEHGDPRGAYLRAEQELAALSEDDPRFADLQREVSKTAWALDAEWLAMAGRRWEVWLLAYYQHGLLRKGRVAQAIRELTGCGQAHANKLAEAAPCPVARSCHRTQAEVSRDHLRLLRGPGTWSVLGGVVASVRPCFVSDIVAPVPGSGWFDLVVLALRPGKDEAFVEVLRQIYSWPDYQARQFLRAPLPDVLNRYAREAAARAAAHLLAESAVVEVRRCELLAAPRVALGKGDYDVWLTAFDGKRQATVVKLYREATATALGPAQKVLEQPTPLLLLKGVNQSSVAQLRELFAGVATLQVRTKPAL
jgi:uncharacterized protein (TIGR02996 family)